MNSCTFAAYYKRDCLYSSNGQAVKQHPRLNLVQVQIIGCSLYCAYTRKHHLV
ncbi:hypothetical protein Mapa_001370 [Marchantia paleacea]|nr:hypothetical protein Mapa_001370 [Marchantia paleacea]